MTPEQRREKHRQINQRPKRCPACDQTVQAGNLARHRRRLCQPTGGRRGPK